MITSHPACLLQVIILTLGFMMAPFCWAEGDAQSGIGIVTAVQGTVTVDHLDPAAPLPVKLQDNVLFKDVIETGSESRTKALLDNESLLTVGENSKVEITEHIYDPKENRRSVVIKLVEGKLRALVGKVFAEAGNRFEIHTSSAVAAARGTYYVVWSQDGASGIVNIGNSGRVDFTSGGQTVSVSPSQFSSAPAGAPPAPAAAVTAAGTPAIVAAVVQATAFAMSPLAETPNAVIQALIKARAIPTTTTTPTQTVQTQSTPVAEEEVKSGSSSKGRPNKQAKDDNKSSKGKVQKASERTEKLLDRAAKEQGTSRSKIVAGGDNLAGQNGQSQNVSQGRFSASFGAGQQTEGGGPKVVLPVAVPVTPPPNVSGSGDVLINQIINAEAAGVGGGNSGSASVGSSGGGSSGGGSSGGGNVGGGNSSNNGRGNSGNSGQTSDNNNSNRGRGRGR